MTDPTVPPRTGDAPETSGPAFDRRMLEALLCPQTHGRLEYDAERQELVSTSAGLAFPIRGGIPVMLIDEARRLD
ncbi:Trm112 family protein [Roseovarius ramblicola]|uniref:UPF0434 protein ACFFU4_00215 n=1 Tax=Roseovarius ramblicola TaxID=2022336 RepID=A0ABV5HUS3_9RHOB